MKDSENKPRKVSPGPLGFVSAQQYLRGGPRYPAVVSAMVLGLMLQVALERTYGRIAVPLASLADTLADGCWCVAKEG